MATTLSYTPKPLGRPKNPSNNTTSCKSCSEIFSTIDLKSETNLIISQGDTWHKDCFCCGATGSSNNGCKSKLDSNSSHYFEGIPYCFSCRFKQRSTKQATTGVFATPVYKLKVSKVEALSPSNTTFSYSLSAFANSNTPAKSKLEALLGGTPVCQACHKSVYKVEEMKVQKFTWHKSCFTCGSGNQTPGTGCHRVLSNSTYEVIQDIPYCKACFTRLTKESIAKLALTTTRKITQAIDNISAKSSIVVDKNAVMEDASDRDIQLVVPTIQTRKGSNYNQENTNPFALNTTKEQNQARVIRNKIVPRAPSINNSNSMSSISSIDTSVDKASVRQSTSASDNVMTANASRPSLTIVTQPIPRLDLQSPMPSQSKIYYPIDDLLADLLAHPPDSPSSRAKLRTFRNSISEPSCPKCYASVTRAEEVSVYGVTWHRRCFCCTDCGVLLRSDSFVEDDALLFCKSCHVNKSTELASDTGIASSVGGQQKRSSITANGSSTVTGSTTITTPHPQSSSLRASGLRPLHQLQMITEESSGNQEQSTTVADQLANPSTARSLASVMASPISMPYRVTRSFEKLSLESPHNSTTIEKRDRHSLSLAGHNRTVRRFSLATNAVSESTPTRRGSATSVTTPIRTSITSYNAPSLIGISPRAAVAASPLLPKVLSARGQSPRKTGAEFDFTFEDKEKTGFQYHLDAVVEDIEKEKIQEKEYALLLSDLVTFTDISLNDVVYRGIHFSHTFDFDDKGVLYWLGSSGKTSFYRNPHTSGRIKASMSSCYSGDPFNIVARSSEHCPNYTCNRAESWVEIDFGPQRLMLVDRYTIRHGSSTTGNALRSWKLQGKVDSSGPVTPKKSSIFASDNNATSDNNSSSDTSEWVTLKEHEDDQSLSENPNSTATWDVEIPGSVSSDLSTLGFRYFRILQTDLNSSSNNCLFCCGLEFYGLLFEKVVMSHNNTQDDE